MTRPDAAPDVAGGDHIAAIERKALSLLAGTTPGRIDVHRCDADGGAIDYQIQRAPGTPATVLGYATDRDGSSRAKADATLWAHAHEMTTAVLTLAAEVRRLRTADLARLRAPSPELAAIGARAAAVLPIDPQGDARVEAYFAAREGSGRPLVAQQAAHAAALDGARAEALREAAASEAGELAARDAAMRGTLAAPSLATMRALHRAGGCWLVSYDDDDSGDPVTTIEYLDGARALTEKEGDNPVRWVAVDRCGRVCLPPQGDDTDGAL